MLIPIPELGGVEMREVVEIDINGRVEVREREVAVADAQLRRGALRAD
jgi:hypothetical protein